MFFLPKIDELREKRAQTGDLRDFIFLVYSKMSKEALLYALFEELSL